jgi:CBS domain-containing protein
MFDRTVRSVMHKRKLVIVASRTTVASAARLMAAKNVGALLVVDGERLVGIVSERDIAFRVVARGLDPQVTPVAQVMTAEPRTISPDRLFGYALSLLHEGGFRHLPVVENDKPIGIVSARSAMDPDMEEFVSEAQRRQHYQQSGRP